MQLFEEARAHLERWSLSEEDSYERPVLRTLDALGPDALWSMLVPGVSELEEVRLEADRFRECLTGRAKFARAL